MKYTNPNLEKEKSDDPKALHHKVGVMHGVFLCFRRFYASLVGTQQVLWRASSYMEVDEAMGGAMQKGVKCDLEMLKLCTPMLRMCDEIFTKWSVDESSRKTDE